MARRFFEILMQPDIGSSLIFKADCKLRNGAFYGYTINHTDYPESGF